MRNLIKSSFILLAVASMTFLASCGDDDTEEPLPDKPTISIGASSTATVAPGETATIAVEGAAAGGFDRIDILLDGAFDSQITAGTFDGIEDGQTTPYAIEITWPLPDSEVGDSYVLTFRVVDKSNQEAEAEHTIDVVSPEAKVQSAVLLYAPTQDENSKTFYSIALDSIYSVNDVEAIAGASGTIDLGYFFVQEANLASPADYSTAFTGAYDISDWTTRRTTLMVETTVADVTEISTVADVEAALDGIDFATSGESTIEGLTVGGTIYAFQTADGLEGLVRVTDLTPGFDEGDNIELEFILAAAAE